MTLTIDLGCLTIWPMVFNVFSTLTVDLDCLTIWPTVFNVFLFN